MLAPHPSEGMPMLGGTGFLGSTCLSCREGWRGSGGTARVGSGFFETCESGAVWSPCHCFPNRGGRSGSTGQTGWHDEDQHVGACPAASTVPSVHLRTIPPLSPPWESLVPAPSHAPTGWAEPA